MPRIIDADKAIEYLENHKRVAKENNFMLAADEDAIIKFISEKCPTIDPESLIPHGRWENIPLNMDQSYFAYRWNLRKRCSVCEYAMPQEWPDFSICPNCGAKMDKEG